MEGPRISMPSRTITPLLRKANPIYSVRQCGDYLEPFFSIARQTEQG
jgi:hypothetical protein